MLVLCVLFPLFALLPRLSTNFRRAFPAMERRDRNRLYLVAGGMSVVWAVVIVVVVVATAVPGPQAGGFGA